MKNKLTFCTSTHPDIFYNILVERIGFIGDYFIYPIHYCQFFTPTEHRVIRNECRLTIKYSILN